MATILIENAIAITIVVIISLNIEEESANISEISHLWILEQVSNTIEICLIVEEVFTTKK